MKCTVCDGRGFFPVSNITAKVCPQCNGTGEIKQTEQEWIQTCTTEQLADWILDVSDECFDCGKSDNGDCPFGKAQGVCTCINKDSVVAWLKQPHTTKEGK